MERRRLQEAQHLIIHRGTCEFHHVIDQCIAASLIRMHEAARQIKSRGGERLLKLPVVTLAHSSFNRTQFLSG
jgi:hypothetical protein